LAVLVLKKFGTLKFTPKLIKSHFYPVPFNGIISSQCDSNASPPKDAADGGGRAMTPADKEQDR